MKVFDGRCASKKQHLGEICCIKSEFLQGALLIPDKQRIQNRLSKM